MQQFLHCATFHPVLSSFRIQPEGQHGCKKSIEQSGVGLEINILDLTSTQDLLQNQLGLHRDFNYI